MRGAAQTLDGPAIDCSKVRPPGRRKADPARLAEIFVGFMVASGCSGADIARASRRMPKSIRAAQVAARRHAAQAATEDAA